MANYCSENGAQMKKIAIIGSGISGLTCAYYLSPHYHVTLFEAGDYIGGHTHTVNIKHKEEQSAIDTGFIVFNDRTYPRFIALLEELDVPFQETEMSFSVRNDQLNLEYSGNNLNTLFAQRKNIINPRFWRLLYDIIRFNKKIRKEKQQPSLETIGEYLQNTKFSSYFSENYLLPMISAIWSMGLEDVKEFPLQFFARFFDNHGLLDIFNRPQWYTIIGGSSSYIKPLTASFKENIHLSTPVKSIERNEKGIALSTASGTEHFDEVIMACHADQTLSLLTSPTDLEKQVLGSFDFTENKVSLHTDISHLPREKKAWASWNYSHSENSAKPTLTYNMNILQQLNKKSTYLVTLNQEIQDEYVIATFTYDHPVYATATIKAQQQWQTVSGADRIHYCGAYWFNGFHEDGVRSGIRVCKSLGVEP